MNKNKMVSNLIHKALMLYVDEETKEEKTHFLNGYPYDIDPNNKRFDCLNAVSLGASFVNNVMKENGPVREAIEAVKSYLRNVHFVNTHELAENTESFLFKTAFCAPAKYIPLLLESGLDVNAKRPHPIYTEVKEGESYPLLVFAVYQGDCDKIGALVDNGADTSCGPVAAMFCLKSDVLTWEQKRWCLQSLVAKNVDIFADQYDELQASTDNEQLKKWLREEKRALDILKNTLNKVAKHQDGVTPAKQKEHE
ncbi:MAG: hypothetical protein J6P93_03495 [Alphaproteobacteria bacterium]|nr:hypothetical protein [Alphaproteobacteria bacterium]